MKQLTFNLDKEQQRPVIKINELDALLDTGAMFPIWTADKQILMDMYDAEFIKKDVTFTGFGGQAIGDLYKIKYFTLGELVYPGLHVVVCENLKDTSFLMILSATMFRNLIYQIDDKNHKLNIDIPAGENNIRNLVIKDSNGKLCVLCGSVPEE